MKVLHVLYVSTPTVDGSSTRSLDIVSSQRDVGLKPVVISSPFQKGLESNSTCDEIDGIKYYRTYANSEELHSSEKHSSIFKRIYKFFFLFKFIKQIKQIAIEEEVDVIHAHSTFFCGLSAKLAGKLCKRPVVYELRSLWEERQKNSKSFIQRNSANLITALETLSMKLANRVIVINENLLENVVERGVMKSRTDVIPNAVNLKRIDKKVSVDRVTLKEKSLLTFGYIGNISEIEGLIDLCEVFKELEQKGYENELLIYGGGPELKNLEEYIHKNDLQFVKLKGMVQNVNIHEAFETIDVIVNPRVRSKITDTVTPLKPLEAMGYKKLVIASNVGGMRELISDNQTGLLFNAGDNNHLQKKVEEVIHNKESFYGIIEDAYDYVQAHKSWHANAKTYEKIYEEIE